jgi:ribonuclease HI
MAKNKPKFYTVWRGRKTGVFDSWDDCKAQVGGFEGALYKSFDSRAGAVKAFAEAASAHIGQSKTPTANSLTAQLMPPPIADSVVVDAAWNTASGDMEYQGIYLPTKQKLFAMGPYSDGTNNIGEFLAIVHALAMLHQRGSNLPVYSDSKTAISWVKKRKANTQLAETARNAVLFDLLDRAETWLLNNAYANPVLKWETEYWGENPADFGRK